jgi:PKD repeat protein
MGKSMAERYSKCILLLIPLLLLGIVIHEASAQVIDNEAFGILTLTDELVCKNESAPATITIIDNSAAGTSYIGEWLSSGAAGYYGPDSLWSRDGATYTWSFTPRKSGNYELSMWWTEWPSRSTKVPVDIQYAGGTETVHINQQQNGGKWNYLGIYPFAAGTPYSITVTAQPGPSSTCADAIRFVSFAGNVPPRASIDSISPNPATIEDNIVFSGAGKDIDGAIAGYSWHSSLDGPIGSLAQFSTGLSAGIHEITFKVQDNEGTWSQDVYATVAVTNILPGGAEPIFIAPGYSPRNGMTLMINTLKAMGATLSNGVWTYINPTTKKKYLIYPVTTPEQWKLGLITEGSHLLYSGHANYGMGQVFATSTEFYNQTITDIYYLDDDRIVNVSSPWMNVSVSGVRTGHAFPFWWPEFKGGGSAIMPYDFGDPRGDPAYNYFPTYRVPGDPKYYKIESARNGAIERFPTAPNPAWYSPTGQKPNSSNSDDRKYFIRNTATWTPDVEVSGNWIASQDVKGYFAEDYFYTSAGQGNSRVKWLFNIPESGNYDVSAWWSASSDRTSEAEYTVTHGNGNSKVVADQKKNGSKWNKLGTYAFNSGRRSVHLTDLAGSGNVVADAIRVSHSKNPPDLIEANFYADVLSGTAPLRVTFRSHNTGDVLKWVWTFGDGNTKVRTDPKVTNIYTKPGTYTVSLTVSGPMGSDTKTKTAYISIDVAPPPVQAEFRASTSSSTTGPAPLTVKFTNLSSESATSWLWDFGDGSTSTSKDPSNTYSKPGNYTVTLKAKDSKGNESTEIKENFVRAVFFEKKVDNVDYPKTHYGSTTIVFRKELEVPRELMKFKRVFYGGCSSAIYYADIFNQGVFFYALDATYDAEIAMSEYLKAYLNGMTDYQIWEKIQSVEPLYDYYDFSKTPSQQQ